MVFALPANILPIAPGTFFLAGEYPWGSHPVMELLSGRSADAYSLESGLPPLLGDRFTDSLGLCAPVIRTSQPRLFPEQPFRKTRILPA